jgi:hypothetical protein
MPETIARIASGPNTNATSPDTSDTIASELAC